MYIDLPTASFMEWQLYSEGVDSTNSVPAEGDVERMVAVASELGGEWSRSVNLGVRDEDGLFWYDRSAWRETLMYGAGTGGPSVGDTIEAYLQVVAGNAPDNLALQLVSARNLATGYIYEPAAPIVVGYAGFAAAMITADNIDAYGGITQRAASRYTSDEVQVGVNWEWDYYLYPWLPKGLWDQGMVDTRQNPPVEGWCVQNVIAGTRFVPGFWSQPAHSVDGFTYDSLPQGESLYDVKNKMRNHSPIGRFASFDDSTNRVVNGALELRTYMLEQFADSADGRHIDPAEWCIPSRDLADALLAQTPVRLHLRVFPYWEDSTLVLRGVYGSDQDFVYQCFPVAESDHASMTAYLMPSAYPIEYYEKGTSTYHRIADGTGVSIRLDTSGYGLYDVANNFLVATFSLFPYGAFLDGGPNVDSRVGSISVTVLGEKVDLAYLGPSSSGDEWYGNNGAGAEADLAYQGTTGSMSFGSAANGAFQVSSFAFPDSDATLTVRATGITTPKTMSMMAGYSDGVATPVDMARTACSYSGDETWQGVKDDLAFTMIIPSYTSVASLQATDGTILYSGTVDTTPGSAHAFQLNSTQTSRYVFGELTVTKTGDPQDADATIAVTYIPSLTFNGETPVKHGFPYLSFNFPPDVSGTNIIDAVSGIRIGYAQLTHDDSGTHSASNCCSSAATGRLLVRPNWNFRNIRQ